MKEQGEIDNKIVLLGIESSGVTCGVGVSVNGQLQGEISVNSKNIHSEKLAQFVEFILKNLQIDIEDLTGIVLSAGPGSFTGLRIGYSLAKGIAHYSNIPIIEIPTLDIWAYQTVDQNIPIMPLIDAYRKEIFYAIYSRENGKIICKSDYAVVKIENLDRIVKQKTMIVGNISQELRFKIKQVVPSTVIFPDPAIPIPTNWALLDLGYQKFTHREFSDLNNCEPFYMRKFKGVS